MGNSKSSSAKDKPAPREQRRPSVVCKDSPRRSDAVVLHKGTDELKWGQQTEYWFLLNKESFVAANDVLKFISSLIDEGNSHIVGLAYLDKDVKQRYLQIMVYCKNYNSTILAWNSLLGEKLKSYGLYKVSLCVFDVNESNSSQKNGHLPRKVRIKFLPLSAKYALSF